MPLVTSVIWHSYQPLMMDDECGALGGRVGRGNPSTQTEPCHTSAFNTSATWPAPGSSCGPRFGKPVINRVRHDGASSEAVGCCDEAVIGFLISTDLHVLSTHWLPKFVLTCLRMYVFVSLYVWMYTYYVCTYECICVFICMDRPPLWSSGQSFWLQSQRSRVRFPALPDFLCNSGSGTGSTQPLWG
jgi:hypothetical protein